MKRKYLFALSLDARLSLRDLDCFNARYFGPTKSIVCLIDGTAQADGAGGVFDDDGLEAERAAVDGGVADAEVVGEADEEEASEVAFA